MKVDYRSARSPISPGNTSRRRTRISDGSGKSSKIDERRLVGIAMKSTEIQRMRRLMKIFMPYAKGKLDRVKRLKKRMVHYTSAESLFNILSSKTMWMRNTHCMADYREVQHGYELLLQFFQLEDHRITFCNALNNCHSGIGEDSLKLFDQWWTNIRFNTYICSISEHEDDEDKHGRLSMWRAFGQQSSARAAIVMKVPEMGMAEGLHLLLSPVAYFDYVEVQTQFLTIIQSINQNIKFLQTFEPDRLKTIVFFMLVSAAVSLKHKGFLEEKEWRVIYLPQANPSPLIERSLEVIGGIPQPVFKIPLKENPDNGAVGIGIPALVDHIIIGPTVYGVPMYTTFVDLLRESGVSDPEKRVVFSDIPIRS